MCISVEDAIFEDPGRFSPEGLAVSLEVSCEELFLRRLGRLAVRGRVVVHQFDGRFGCLLAAVFALFQQLQPFPHRHGAECWPVPSQFVQHGRPGEPARIHQVVDGVLTVTEDKSSLVASEAGVGNLLQASGELIHGQPGARYVQHRQRPERQGGPDHQGNGFQVIPQALLLMAGDLADPHKRGRPLSGRGESSARRRLWSGRTPCRARNPGPSGSRRSQASERRARWKEEEHGGDGRID